MDRFDRIFALHKLLATRRSPVSRQRIEDELGCSRATAKRLIDDLRTYLNAPVCYDRERNGYFLDRSAGQTIELPGLWFNAEEAVGLLMVMKLLGEMRPGLLCHELAPLRNRISQLTTNKRTGMRGLAERLRILPIAFRTPDLDTFRQAADALAARRRMRVLYHGRERDELTERWLSPQRLVYYRDNWYLDAWCHLREALRSFALDRLHIAEVDGIADDLGDEVLDGHYAAAYGIFAGNPIGTARIRFNSNAARWVADEQWHSRQTSTVLPDGGLELCIPYSDTRELVRDLLKYGPDAEVIEPPELRQQMAEMLDKTRRLYRDKRRRI